MKNNETNNKSYEPDIPDQVIESLARCILPSIRAYFDSEEGKKNLKGGKEKNTKTNILNNVKYEK